ncbi:MAG: transcriptional repressor [Thermodesulfobacteriota bacterium]
MKQIHAIEREQFEKLFRQEAIDCLEDRLVVLDAFLLNEDHITPEDLEAYLKMQGYSFSSEFIVETLELMCRFGFAQKNHFQNGVQHYEHKHLGQHHDHMVCTKCGNVVEFESQQLEELQRRIARDYNFYMLQHRMEIYGICPRCQTERAQKMPLVLAKPGEKLIIKDLIGGNASRVRLMSMGLRVGDKVEILTNFGKGQVVVVADDQRYVLGRGLAQKIIVEVASAEKRR